ncbi:NAD-dependent protein deacetylase [Massilia yuzhufengensis]|uniref:protein acetyllysine N-acetyltransferase n=1 Tax=Massilia yuzhufengensis TaxID=1164594 RepID=A0A1I1QXU2_9BURK|nr:NAD-dependent protein deacetylase [Massilia yuzhufengensis]SFD26926.1 NAD-dependent protein deacetylase, SIR2 family [Massilia yuzhufengensis]
MADSELHDGARALAQFLERHPRALVLTGAGLSTASGIPDYRDRDGTRRGRLPIQGPEFRRSVDIQRRYWARSMVGWPVMARAAPNAGHRALAALGRHGRFAHLLTQNVDGLHQRAGSHDVLELHGNVHSVVCLHCKQQLSRAFVQTLLEEANPDLANVLAAPLPDGDAAIEPDALEDFHLPFCVHCGGTLSPDVVFFGDGIPPTRTASALARMAAADALLVVGSSLMVYSGFRFCRMAAEAGKPIAAVNLGRTRADDMIALKLEESAERLLPRVAGLLRAEELEESLPP